LSAQVSIPKTPVFLIDYNHDGQQEASLSLHFLSRAARTLARRLADAAQAPARATDPIDHPAIAAMDLRELADLPLSPPPRPPPIPRPCAS
jgi:hypothetical protein